MGFVENGVKAPFKSANDITGYQHYECDCLMQNLDPVSEKKYTQWIEDGSNRARANFKKIVARLKKHNLYVM